MKLTRGFSVTYETVTPESAEYGDVDDSGFLLEESSFRDAITYLEPGSHIEADCSPVNGGVRWFTAYGERNYLARETENISLHLPKNLTVATRLRIARYLGVS